MADNIDAVESLGDIDPESLDKISRIISGHRRLRMDTLGLFLGIQHER